jgi:hypothetical protein
MSRSEKINILLMEGTGKLQMVSHKSVLKMGNAKKIGERCLGSLSFTPNIMPETNFGTITYLKSSLAR